MTSTPVSPSVSDDLAGLPYPRLAARTQSLRLGVPRAVTVSPDGERVVFVRSSGPTDRVNRLVVLDVSTGTERVVVDPAALLSGDEDLPPEERARRERMRETTGGVTAFATDRAVTMATFALSGQLYVVSLMDGAPARALATPGAVIDPRMSPDGHYAAAVISGGVHLVRVADGTVTPLATPDHEHITYGLADFIAAEELERFRGHWWSPDSDAVLIERVDVSAVPQWWISDPAKPQQEPTAHRYPAAGTTNADLGLVIARLDGTRTEVHWDRERFEYLVTVGWQAGHEPLLTVMTRDQRHQHVLTVDVTTGQTRVLHERTDTAWVEWITGLPRWLGADLLVHHDDPDDDTRRIVGVRDGMSLPLTPTGLQIGALLEADDTTGTLLVQATDDATRAGIYRVSSGTATRVSSLTYGWQVGTASGALENDTLVVMGSDLDQWRADWIVVRRDREVARIASFAATPDLASPPVKPRVQVHQVGQRQLNIAVVLPENHVAGTRLPVLMNPYGGPHHREVIRVGHLFSEDQFLANQGFAVVIVDGRGTPMRGPAWDRAIHHDLLTPVLEDQVDGLREAARLYPDLDLTRVAIRGWSFGGYLSAAAVLLRPDVFHVAIAGAPVTDWRLYDTGYTERYLGHPDTSPHAYARTDLTTLADRLERPLMLIHGLADDNVVAAHTLTLSSALLAAGKPHTVLPLSGVTHMTPQEIVTENLLRIQVQYLKEHLGS